MSGRRRWQAANGGLSRPPSGPGCCLGRLAGATRPGRAPRAAPVAASARECVDDVPDEVGQTDERQACLGLFAGATQHDVAAGCGVVDDRPVHGGLADTGIALDDESVGALGDAVEERGMQWPTRPLGRRPRRGAPHEGKSVARSVAGNFLPESHTRSGRHDSRIPGTRTSRSGGVTAAPRRRSAAAPTAASGSRRCLAAGRSACPSRRASVVRATVGR